MFYKKYVNDIFVLFKRLEHVKPFVDYMHNKHKNINFSFEMEKDGQVSDQCLQKTNIYWSLHQLFEFHTIRTQIWNGLYITPVLMLSL